MSHVDFISNSNKRAQEDKRWCERHGWRAFWGKMDSGEWFPRCVEGNKLNEDCVEGSNE